MVDSNNNTKNSPKSTSPAAYPFIGSAASTPTASTTTATEEENKQQETPPKSTSTAAKTNTTTSKKNSFSPSPLPNFLKNNSTSHSTQTTEIPKSKNYHQFSSVDEKENLSDKHFTWIQNYLAKSNQYFFCVNRFTIFGLFGGLFLLGTLFFTSGFLCALLLFSNAGSIAEKHKTVLLSPAKDTEVILTTESIKLPPTEKKKNLKQTQEKHLDKKNTHSKKVSLKNTKPLSYVDKAPAKKKAIVLKKKEDLKAIPKLKKTVENNSSPHTDVANTSSKTIKKVAKNTQTQHLYKSLTFLSTSQKKAALEKAEELRKKGYNVFIVYRPAASQEDPLYRVQMGAYKDQTFAKSMLEFMEEQFGAGNISMSDGLLQDLSERIIDAY